VSGGFVDGLFTFGVGVGACGQFADPAPEPAVVLHPVPGVVVFGVVDDPGVVALGEVVVVLGVELGAVVSGIVPGGVTPGVTVPGGICWLAPGCVVPPGWAVPGCVAPGWLTPGVDCVEGVPDVAPVPPPAGVV
jgi:hypothetical protein